jgi:hypothetical protein
LVEPSNSSRKSRVSKQHFEGLTDGRPGARLLLNSSSKVIAGCPAAGCESKNLSNLYSK